MGILKSSQTKCPMEQHCSQWAAKYMQHCVCSTKDWVSLVLGIISVMTWFVAEIPQIITNYEKKTAEGVSLAFLLTWIAADLMNLFGCILEPTTLSTQYYMALLFTMTTFFVTGQAIYYGYIYKRPKAYKCVHEVSQSVDVTRKDPNGVTNCVGSMGNQKKCSGSEVSANLPVTPISDPHVGAPKEQCLRSPRSLSLGHSLRMEPFPLQRSTTSDFVSDPIQVPLLSEVRSQQSVPPSNVKTMFCVASFVIFLLGSFNLQIAQRSEQMLIFQNPREELAKRVARKLLQVREVTMVKTSSMKVNGIGTLLGWGMALIYMGGRLPQICLNIRRGNAEGLNPLMFVFALVGNTTYVASILVSSIAWSKIKPNLPWLVDAGGCVLLDTFILMQFIYFHCCRLSEIS